MECMSGPSVAHLKFALGLLTSRFRANHPLKACPKCMADDIATHGWTYWHTPQQWPGVWVCAKHGEPLRVSGVKSNGVERFLWHVPTTAQLAPPIDLPTEHDRDALTRLSQTVKRLTRLDVLDGEINMARMREALRAKAMSHGWLTRAGHLRLREAAPSYAAHCARLRSISELRALPADAIEASEQIGRLLRPMRTGTHPLRLLVAIDWMYGDPEAFLADLRMVPAGLAADADERVPSAPSAATKEDQHRELLDLVQAGRPITAAARQLRVDVATAMAWAADMGVASRRRPKRLKPDMRPSMMADLTAGQDKSEVAQRYGVSLVTVTRLLRTEPGLHRAWKDARFSSAQRAARLAWSNVLQQQPTIGVKWMRMLCPADYAWLYRNDRAWLKATTPSESDRVQAVINRGVRWDERDEALSQAVRVAALALVRAQPGKSVRLWQIYQRVPDLKAKLGSLDRLPRTRAALDIALKTRGPSQGAARLID
jgi:hypothetical protein